MTLWCIFRSPLFFGGDLTRIDAATLDLLTNPEVLAVNRHSRNNRQLSRRGDHVAWLADADDGGGKYLALFNLADGEPVDEVVSLSQLGLRASADIRNLWTRRDLGPAGEIRLSVPSHGARLLKVSAGQER